jgi:hypothetical protein
LSRYPHFGIVFAFYSPGSLYGARSLVAEKAVLSPEELS